MAQPKFTLYKYVKLQGGWRYCKAAFHENVKIKPNVVIVGKDKHEEKHPEGSHYLAHAARWIPVGDNALEAQAKAAEIAGGIPTAHWYGASPKFGRSNGVRQDSTAGGSGEVFLKSRSSRFGRQDHPNIPDWRRSVR